jgi:hypothetical protein
MYLRGNNHGSHQGGKSGIEETGEATYEAPLAKSPVAKCRKKYVGKAYLSLGAVDIISWAHPYIFA